jgi:hypothetical protein
LQPGIITPPARKVTFAATLTSADIVVVALYVVEVTPPDKANELIVEGVVVLW